MRILLLAALLLIVGCVARPVDALEAAPLLVSGTYKILICKKLCSATDKENVVVEGDLVLFAEKLEQKNFDRFDRNRFNHHRPGEAINGCFTLRTLVKGQTYAGIEEIGLTSWSPHEDKLTFALFHSPDAGYEVEVKHTSEGFAGTGVSWGAGASAPSDDERGPDIVIARRTGDAALTRCVFQTEEEALLAKIAADPVRKQIRDIESRYQASVAEALSASSAPRDWALAALIGTWGKNSEHKRSRLIKRAMTAAPDDTFILWIAVQQAQNLFEVGTTIVPPLPALQRIEPDNVAVWAQALSDAEGRGDEATVDSTLRRMAAGKNFTVHAAEILKAQLNAYQRYPMSDLYFELAPKLFPGLSTRSAWYRVAARSSGLLLIEVPGLHELYTACSHQSSKGQALDRDRAESCVKIGHLLAEASTEKQGISDGLWLLDTTGLFTDEDKRIAREHDWIAEQFWKAYRDQPHFADPPIEETVRYLDDWCNTSNEFEAMRRVVIRAGLSVQPPKEWVDPIGIFKAPPATL